jgi:hypothetical protein
MTRNKFIVLGWIGCFAGVWSLYCTVTGRVRRVPVDRRPVAVSPSDPAVSGAHALLNDGSFYRLSRQLHTVRVRSDFWYSLDRDGKAGVVGIWSRYFEATTGAGWCKVLGDVNDDVWAEWSVWSGAKVYR